MMPWPRFGTILSATIAEADPTLAACRWTTAGRQAKPGSTTSAGPPSRHPRWLAETPTRTRLLPAPIPTGNIYLVTDQGTLALGRSPFSAAIWDASKPKPSAIFV
jgi:hypothetical protein